MASSSVLSGYPRPIRSKLDPLESAADASGQGLGEQGFPEPGHILDEDVAIGQQGHQQQLTRFALAHHDAADILQNGLAGSIFQSCSFWVPKIQLKGLLPPLSNMGSPVS